MQVFIPFRKDESTRTMHFGLPFNRPNPNCSARRRVFISFSASFVHVTVSLRPAFHGGAVHAIAVGGSESIHFDFNFILWISNLISPFSGRESWVSPVLLQRYWFMVIFYCPETFYRAHVARSAHKIASGSNKFLWLKTDNERVCVEHVLFAFSQYSLLWKWRFQSNHRPSQKEHFVALPHMRAVCGRLRDLHSRT